jgi:hypothetical protein
VKILIDTEAGWGAYLLALVVADKPGSNSDHPQRSDIPYQEVFLLRP